TQMVRKIIESISSRDNPLWKDVLPLIPDAVSNLPFENIKTEDKDRYRAMTEDLLKHSSKAILEYLRLGQSNRIIYTDQVEDILGFTSHFGETYPKEEQDALLKAVLDGTVTEAQIIRVDEYVNSPNTNLSKEDKEKLTNLVEGKTKV